MESFAHIYGVFAHLRREFIFRSFQAFSILSVPGSGFGQYSPQIPVFRRFDGLKRFCFPETVLFSFTVSTYLKKIENYSSWQKFPKSQFETFFLSRHEPGALPNACRFSSSRCCWHAKRPAIPKGTVGPVCGSSPLTVHFAVRLSSSGRCCFP